MGDGSLSLERFSFYMRQDYLCLIDYYRVLALASAKSPDLASVSHFASLLDETLKSETAAALLPCQWNYDEVARCWSIGVGRMRVFSFSMGCRV